MGSSEHYAGKYVTAFSVLQRGGYIVVRIIILNLMAHRPFEEIDNVPIIPIVISLSTAQRVADRAIAIYVI